MQLTTGPDKKEVLQKLDRKLFQALEGYGIKLHNKWINIIDRIENSIRIANEAAPGSDESKLNLDLAVSMAYRLLIDIYDVAREIRRDRKDPSSIECQTFAANTAMAISVLYELFEAYGLEKGFANQIENQFGIRADETVIDIQNRITDSLKPRHTLPIGASREARVQAGIVTGLSPAAVPLFSNGGLHGEGEKTNPYGIDIDAIRGTAPQATGNGDTGTFTPNEPDTRRGVGTNRPAATTPAPAQSTAGSASLDSDREETTQVTEAPILTVGSYPGVDSDYPPSGLHDAGTSEDLAATQELPEAQEAPQTARGLGSYSIINRGPTADNEQPVPQHDSDAPTVEVSGPAVEKRSKEAKSATPFATPDQPTPGNPQPPSADPTRLTSNADEDTAPFSSRDMMEALAGVGGSSRVPNQPLAVTVHKMDPIPPEPASVSRPSLAEPNQGPQGPYREPAAQKAETLIIPTPAEPPKPQESLTSGGTTETIAITSPGSPSTRPKPETGSVRPPREQNFEQTAQDTRSDFRKWLNRNGRAVVLLGGLVGVGATFGGYKVLSAETQNAQTAEVNTAAPTATPPPPVTTATANPKTEKIETAPKYSGRKRTYKIDTFHEDFQNYLKSLNGASGIIDATNNVAANLNVELNGNETAFEQQILTYSAFLAKGRTEYSGKPGIYGVLTEWKRALDKFQTATKDMSDEQKMEYLERGEFKQIRPHLSFARNRTETTIPEGVKGYTVELDPAKNGGMAVFLKKYKDQAPTLFETIKETYQETATKPFKSGHFQEMCEEFMERVKEKARAKIAAHPNVPDGSLHVLGEIDKYFIRKGKSHMILEPLRQRNPIIEGKQDGDSSSVTHPTTPIFAPVPVPSHTYNSPAINPTHINPNPFSPFNVDSLDDGWDFPEPEAPQKVAQHLPTTVTPASLQLRSLSTANKPKTAQEAKQMVRDLAAQITTGQSPNMRLAPVMPIAPRPAIAQRQPINSGVTLPATRPAPRSSGHVAENKSAGQISTKESAFTTLENNFFRAGEQLSQPKQTIGQKIAGYASRAISYVKEVFAGSPLTPAQQEKRELQAQIPKKSFLKNLFG